ncbi:MAG: TatD family hydrolase [Candidatus Hydrogenedentes bacterium]|nr:TatD family hydrolase [Candidatus Hydrogenedentota bacterium]
MKFIDSHCHLEAEEFAHDLPNIISDGVKSGIVKFITSSVVPEQWEKSIGLTYTYSQVECTCGIHPWYIKESHFPSLNTLEKIIEKHKVVGIGEIGLDRKIEGPPFELQEEIFIKQLEIAKKINIPVVVHCRGAFPDLIRIIKKVGLPNKGGMIHAYKGNLEITKQLLPLGFYFSFGCSITFPQSNKKIELLKLIYPDKILIETDSPDIPPVGKAEERNIPSNILLVVKELSKYLEKNEEEIAEVTTRNAYDLFSLNL